LASLAGEFAVSNCVELRICNCSQLQLQIDFSFGQAPRIVAAAQPANASFSAGHFFRMKGLRIGAGIFRISAKRQTGAT
jgi:hypothetical protein